MHTFTRRLVLKRGLVVAAAWSVIAAGLVAPQRLLAKALGSWPQSAFDAEEIGDVMSSLFESDSPEESTAVRLVVPDIAENGTVVPVTVTTSLSDVESVTILAEQNPRPLAARFTVSSAFDGYVSTRLKLAKTQNVTAIVRAGDKLHRVSKSIKVTVGGCGG